MSVARPTRKPVKDPGPIDTTRPSNCLSVRPAVRNSRSIVGSNSLACDPAASWSCRARTLDSSRIATLCHEVAVSTASTFIVAARLPKNYVGTVPQNAQTVRPARPQASRNRKRTLWGYVEDFDEPRTKLEDCFSILLDLTKVGGIQWLVRRHLVK